MTRSDATKWQPDDFTNIERSINAVYEKVLRERLQQLKVVQRVIFTVNFPNEQHDTSYRRAETHLINEVPLRHFVFFYEQTR